MNRIVGDVFSVSLPSTFGLIYADPPYAGCRFKYARGNKSRQWGRDARADYMRELLARMESLRSEGGMCALSIATPELRLLHLFPSRARVAAWVKDNGQFRPNVWPTFGWEPIVLWGDFPTRSDQITVSDRRLTTCADRPGGVPFDWFKLPKLPRRVTGKHENPKPAGFGDALLDMTIGPRTCDVLELFGGTCPVSEAAEARGLQATAVDLVFP